MVNAAFLDLTLDEKATLEDWEAFACRLKPLAKRDPSAQFKLRRAENTIAMLRAEQEGNLKAFLETLKRPGGDAGPQATPLQDASASEGHPTIQSGNSDGNAMSGPGAGGGTFVELRAYSFSPRTLRNRRRKTSAA